MMPDTEASNQIITPAATLYADLEKAAQLQDIRATYREYGRVLRLVADQQTSFQALHLGSLYAKVDYLCREHDVERWLAHMVNDARVRLRRLIAQTDDELREASLYDLRAIALFIAKIYDEEVPRCLVQRFPEGRKRAPQASVVADYFRLYVTRWDDRHLYGHCAELPDEEEITVSYSFTSKSLHGDWLHIRPYLTTTTQVNVVRPRLYNGVYYPEQLILDPDYLVDITSITQCYAEYAHSPLLYLLGMISPKEDTAATMLGNLAGQLLDEEVYGGDRNDRQYADSYAEFIRANTFKALTIDLKDMQQDGATQQQNIHRALHEGLAQRVGRYDASQVMLEPSFFSEMLGLQGRMDMLQLDYRVLLEQKSGKSQWPYPSRPTDVPRPVASHYLQLLLYQAILYYNYGMANNEIQAMLLYSKYPNGLIGVSAAPAMLHEALALRNQLVGMARGLCHDGFRVLTSLRPQQLLQRQEGKGLWPWIEPKLTALLDTVQQASALERAYYLRFLSFVALEHRLQKIGNQSKENSGFAAKWHDSLEEKYLAGNIYDQLTLLSPDSQHVGHVERLVFGFAPDRASDMSNFRLGDIVIAYPYALGTEPDARRSMVMRGNIEAINADTLCIRLRAPQSHPDIFMRFAPCDYAWAVEHDFMESSYRGQYASMQAFLSAPQQRRDLLLLQRQPVVDPMRQLSGHYGAFDALQLRVRQACDLFLIIGPPGTGKTSYGMLYTLQEQLLEPGANVLITSFTNRAVDEICSKLVEQQIPFLRIGSLSQCSPEYRSYLLDVQLGALHTLAEMRQLLAEVRVVVGTTTSLTNHLPLFDLKQFRLAIIDEASQILEPHLLGLLSASHDGQAAIERFVMIGDHKQLPAVVQQRPSESAVTDPLLQQIGLTDCRLSLFERLLHRYHDDPRVVYMLTHQGRMHRDIADFPNQAFYQGKLQLVPLEHQQLPLPDLCTTGDAIDRMLAGYRVAFVTSALPDPIVSDKVNMVEAQQIAATAARICQQHESDFDPLSTLGIIVPYRNQIAAIRNAIEAYGYPALRNITIDTVERYQGSQRDYILYGFTIQREYQLNFLTNNTFVEEGQLIDRKLNVAMTRARLHLFMFGNPELLSVNPVFASLLDYLKERNAILTL